MHKKFRFSGFVIPLILLLTLVSTSLAAPVDSSGPDRGQVTIIRDEYGVPHVYGSTLESVWFGVGYAQGHDRLWQADLLRRTATGSSAEIFGPSAVAGDAFARLFFGPPERRAAIFDAASPETQIIFEAFTDGMNAWIQEAQQSGQLPVEYQALGVSPRPWTVDDSLAETMLLLNNFGEFGADELTNAADLQELIARFGPVEGQKVFDDTHWLNDPSATTSVPAEGAIGAVRHFAAPKAELPPGAGRGLNQYQTALKAWKENLNRAGLSLNPKSNAFVIAPKLSADGHALLLGGPQMGYTVPQINHEIGIHGAGFDITGMNIAGLPGIPIGVAGEFAWTMTSGTSDNNDIYYEVLNPADPTQYLFQGQWLNFDCRVETIMVRGTAEVQEQFCNSVHGPVIGTAPDLAFTLKSAVRGLEIQGFEVFYGMAQAKSVEEFDQVLSTAVYNFNILYADARGNIGYWHVGKIPVRAEGDNPWLPHNGTGVAEWQGFIPWDQMPHALNPDRGWLTSWNNKPAPGWENSVRGFGDFGPVHRVNTLTHLLGQIPPGSATTSTLEAINRQAGWTTDTPSGSANTVFVSTLLDDMLAHVDVSADARLPEVTGLLSSWDWLQVDGDMDGYYDSPAVALFNTWWQTMSAQIFADDLGDTLQPNVVGNLAYRMLVSDPALPLQHDYLGGPTVEQAFTNALIDSLDQLTVQYGSPEIADWLQPVAQIYWSPLGAGSVPNTIWMNRGTYNQIVHLGKGPQQYAENVVAPGQSGDPFSPHFADQLQLYATWTYKPMRLTRPDLKGFTESVIHLNPGPR
jgi:penicillin amidase